jgi:hypothetical protein
MRLTISNNTRREWIVSVEPGTKLESSSDGVQSMVVTEEIKVTLHAHEQQSVDVPTACLDISKATPAMADALWRTTTSEELRTFIACVNRFVDTQKASAPQDEADSVESRRAGTIQAALWDGRGATNSQWVDYFIRYQGATKAEALDRIPGLKHFLSPVRVQCPGAL